MPRGGAPALRKAEKPRLERPARHAGEDERLLELHDGVVAVREFQRAKLVASQRVSRPQRLKLLSEGCTGRLPGVSALRRCVALALAVGVT